MNDHSDTRENESTYISDSYIGDVFYTPDCCLNPKFEFIPPPTIISDISTDLQPLSTHIDPLFSRDATEFICNLNPQNSSIVTGASTTQSCKVSTHNCKPLRRSKRNNRMMSTNTGLPIKVKHSPQKTNGLTPKSFNKSHNESCLLVEQKNFSFQVDDSITEIPINATSTPLQPPKKKKKYVRKDNKYPKDKISHPEQVPKIFKCDQCPKRCATIRALNIHKHMHRRLAMDSSGSDNTSSLATRRSLRQISAKKYMHKRQAMDSSGSDNTSSLATRRSLRQISAKKYMHKRLAMDSSGSDNTSSLATRRSLRQISAKKYMHKRLAMDSSGSDNTSSLATRRSLRQISAKKYMHKRLAMDSSGSDNTSSLATRRSLRQISAKKYMHKRQAMDSSGSDNTSSLATRRSLRQISAKKYMHKRQAMDSSGSDNTSSLATRRSLRQISAKNSLTMCYNTNNMLS